MPLVLSGNTWKVAPALVTLAQQLRAAAPGPHWIASQQTGTIGDQRHMAEGWTDSDHNPFTAPTGRILPVGAAGGLVRALDIAANVSGVQGIDDVDDAPDCEALFWMVQRMYAAKDPRVFPDGYGIYLRRITDPKHPGQVWPQTGDPHLYHLHISLSSNPAGFNSTAPWPLPGTIPGPEAPTSGPGQHQLVVEDGMYEVLRNAQSGAVRAGGLGFWRALNTAEDIANALNGPLCRNVDRSKPRDVSDPGMTWWKNFYLNAPQ